MTNLINTNFQALTMSTVEIAALTGKRHDNVMRAGRDLETKGIITTAQIEELFRVGNGALKARKIYQLNKTESLNLVARLSPEFTARIINRWLELEEQAPAEALKDPAILRGLLLDNVEKVLALEADNAELQPKAAAYENLACADGTLCITDASKSLGKKPKDAFAWLRSLKWIYRRAGNAHWVGYQDKIQAGYLDHKVKEVTRSDGSTKITEQVRVTAKGLSKLAELIERECA